jgi:hypothetical protein
MSTYWGYHCRTCHVSSASWINHGDDQLATLWELRHCVTTLHNAAGGMIEVEIIGFGTAPAWWVQTHWQHDVVLENEYGDRKDIQGNDARNYADTDCDCPPVKAVATVPYDGDYPITSRLRDALKTQARRIRIEPDWTRWHWWDTGRDFAAHVPPEPRPAPHHATASPTGPEEAG